MASQKSFNMFEARHQSHGLRSALAWLLSLTDYRFIAIFGFKGGSATALVFFDRENPDVLSTDEVPESATFCTYVRDGKASFSTADALRDPRLIDHAARDVVRAYCGVPILDAEGRVLGTLCHYDLVPRNPAQIDLDLMLQVASKLAYEGLVPPYPADIDGRDGRDGREARDFTARIRAAT